MSRSPVKLLIGDDTFKFSKLKSSHELCLDCTDKKDKIPAFTKFYRQESTKKPRSLSWHNLSCNLSQKNYQLCTVDASNIHDSTKFVDVLENTLDLLGDDYIEEIIAAYADKGFDAKSQEIISNLVG